MKFFDDLNNYFNLITRSRGLIKDDKSFPNNMYANPVYNQLTVILDPNYELQPDTKKSYHLFVFSLKEKRKIISNKNSDMFQNWSV